MWDGVDRRKFHRAEYPCLVTLRRTVQAPLSVLTHTEDISAVGVNVIVSEKFDIMSEVDIDLDLKDTLPPIKVKGVVRWSKEILAEKADRKSRYSIGVQFMEMDSGNRRRIQELVEYLAGKGQ